MIALLACSAVAACGGTAATTPVTASNFGAQFGGAICARKLACCAGVSGLTTAAKCTARLGDGFYQPALDAETATGHVTFDAATAATCLSDLQNLPCGNFLSYAQIPASCFAVTTGSLATGANCTFGAECATTSCGGIKQDSSGHVTAPGKCAVPGGPGQACVQPNQSGATCAAGATIDPSTAPACLCKVTLANGGSCDLHGQCTSSYCDPGTSKCAAIPQVSSLAAASCQDLRATNYP